MNDSGSIHGEIWIDAQDGNWTIETDSQKRGDVMGLRSDCDTINRVNPSSGLTFLRHLKHAEGCIQHLRDTDAYALCLDRQKRM